MKKRFFYLFSPVNLVSVPLIPLAAQIWVIPLQMCYFNNIAPLGVLANIAVVPFIGMLSFLGFLGSIFALFPLFSELPVKLFDFIANPLLGLLIKISGFFSSFKNSLIDTPSLTCAQIFLYWGAVLLFILNFKNNFKKKKEIFGFVFILVIFLLSFVQIKSDNLEISMFDVESADCFLIKTPKKKYIMIDTGKKSYNGSTSYETTVKRYLLNKRIKNIELLVLTHFDLDHAGGYKEIIEHLNPKLVIIQSDIPKTPFQKEVIDYLKENKINYKVPKNLETVYFEPDLDFRTITPFDNEKEIKNSNENSIAELLSYKNKKILFMADLDSTGYEKIKNYLPEKIDILKVGHHGAKNSLSNAMLQKLKPDYALISAGSKKFNHPNSDTVELLNKQKTKTLITRYHGYLKIVIDKNSLINVYCFFKDPARLKKL